MRRLLLAAAGSAALLLAGCEVGPKYRTPQVETPANWTEHEATAAELARTQSAMRSWWASFGDPVLDRLVDQVVAGNLDIQIASQRLLAARDLRDQIAGGLYPQLDAVTANGIQRFSTTLEYPPLPGISSSNRFWEFGFTASWELDVFGRIHRSIEAQQAAVEAGVEQRRGVLVAALAELATDYVSLRAAQRQLQIADDNIQAAQEALDLTNRLYSQGVGTTLQVAQAQSELESEQATRPPLTSRIAQLSHAIGVLAGALPATDEAMLSQPAPLPAVPPLPVALPSTVIANRPDIREAERQYAQATARIGVAVAQLYPDFTIPLSFTPQSSMLHELLTSSSLAWSLLLQSSIPLWHGGRLAAQVREARADAAAAELNYRRTVLHAFGEVEDRLVAYRDDAERAEALRKAARDSMLAQQRARKLYSAGLTGFLDVLTTERSTYAAQNAELLASLARLQDAIGLFQAMGAGWQGVPLTAELPVDRAAQNAMAARHRKR